MKKTILIMTLLVMSIALTACEQKLSEDEPVDGPYPTTFEECVAVGGTVTESFPRQCFLGNDSFTEDSRQEGDISVMCESAGGNWIEESMECEGLAKESCEAAGGSYNECASACRNDPDAEICTMQCVLVCEFNQKEESGADIEEFSIGPELKDCTGVAPQKCMVVNDKYFYNSIEGFDYEEGYTYELTVKKTERENVPADASSFVYTLVEVVSKTPVIPEGCTSWFDGCNTCMVEDGVLGGCTRMYCETPQPTKCLAFEK